MRQSKDENWWEEETAFILAESKKKVKMGAFKEYCRMQAHFAEKDGFFSLSQQIKKAGE